MSLNIFGKSVCKIKNAPQNTIYLTFDDGPSPNITPRVLELLKKYNQKATFFCIAENAKKYPEIVRKIVKDGHTLGSHDLHHHWTSNFRMTKKMTEEIGESVRILEDILNTVRAGFKPAPTKIRLYRPPVGLSNPHLFGALKKLDLQCVGWSKSTRDGGNRILSAIKNIPNLAKATAAQDGDIILLHDNSPVQNEELFLEKVNGLLANLQEFRKKSLPLSV
ncbi:MAG: polysaccharide deacetylase family protein [Chitinivibrionia bacterium]|nr:polysaccharide deacetylase family protein [Chitinivibrionia bacterium]